MKRCMLQQRIEIIKIHCIKNKKYPEFHRKIIFTDEAHFQHGGFVNKQNCRIWISENPRPIVEKPLHSQRVTVDTKGTSRSRNLFGKALIRISLEVPKLAF